jgi:hypothetical protein
VDFFYEIAIDVLNERVRTFDNSAKRRVRCVRRVNTIVAACRETLQGS